MYNIFKIVDHRGLGQRRRLSPSGPDQPAQEAPAQLQDRPGQRQNRGRGRRGRRQWRLPGERPPHSYISVYRGPLPSPLKMVMVPNLFFLQ